MAPIAYRIGPERNDYEKDNNVNSSAGIYFKRNKFIKYLKVDKSFTKKGEAAIRKSIKLSLEMCKVMLEKKKKKGYKGIKSSFLPGLIQIFFNELDEFYSIVVSFYLKTPINAGIIHELNFYVGEYMISQTFQTNFMCVIPINTHKISLEGLI